MSENTDGAMPQTRKVTEPDFGMTDGGTPKADVAAVDLSVAQVYPAEGKLTDTARALVKAADDLGLSQSVIVYTDGHYRVPTALAEAADLPEADLSAEPPAPPKSATTDAGNGGIGTGEPTPDPSTLPAPEPDAHPELDTPDLGAGTGLDVGAEPEPEAAPTERWSKADLQGYATDHNVEFADADTKAVLLEKISAAPDTE